jgi:hypothetical protein
MPKEREQLAITVGKFIDLRLGEQVQRIDRVDDNVSNFFHSGQYALGGKNS